MNLKLAVRDTAYQALKRGVYRKQQPVARPNGSNIGNGLSGISSPATALDIE
jgi:hypothetical protein